MVSGEKEQQPQDALSQVQQPDSTERPLPQGALEQELCRLQSCL